MIGGAAKMLLPGPAVISPNCVTWIYVSHEAQKWHLSDYPF